MLDDVGKELGYLCRAVRGDMNIYIHIRMHIFDTLTLTHTLILALTFTFTFTLALTHIGSLCVCVLCVCVSVCPREDTRIVRPSIYPLNCLYVRLSVWAVFSPSVCRFVCLSFHESFCLYFLFYLLFELLVC